MSVLEVQEGVRIQHTDEEIVRTVDFDPATTEASVTSPSVKVIQEDDGTDVTSTVMPTNSPSASTLVVTLSILKLLTAGKSYRVEVTVTAGSNKLVSIHRVRCPY